VTTPASPVPGPAVPSSKLVSSPATPSGGIPEASGGGFSDLFPRPGYQAAPGWDPVTGWGSPNAQALIPLLARYTSP
jgi:hypothetical protein